MLSVLIVDDETYVSDGIERNIAWAEFGVGRVEQARTGREGLEKALQTKPDLIISDVRMPHMDGLAMATALMARNVKAHYIFMSAYSELDYYRKAMKLHAVSFIEKPIVLEELEQEIRRAVELIEAENGTARLSEAEAAQYALLGLLHQNDTSSAERLKLELAADRAFGVFVLGRTDTLTAERERRLGEELARLLSARVWTASDGQYHIFLLSAMRLAPRQLTTAGNLFLNALKPDAVYATVAACTRVDELPILYHRAKERQVYAFFHDGACLDCTLLAPQRGQLAMQPDEHLLMDVRDAAADADFNRITRLLSGFFDNEHTMAPDQARSFALRMLNAIREGFRRQGVTELAVCSWDTLAAIPSFSNLHKYCVSQAEGFMAKLDEIRQKGRGVFAVQQIIERNYKVPGFSIASLAEEMHFSESYLGNQFRKRFHMSIGAYVNQLRMEEAKLLLLNPSARIRDVAAQVGFDNTDYFTKRFRQYTGRTPTEYRR